MTSWCTKMRTQFTIAASGSWYVNLHTLDHYASVPQCQITHEDELTIRVCSGDHSWSFLVILAMAMTMTINSNSVLLIRVASAGRYECFEHVQKVCVPSNAQHEYFSFVVMRIENV